MVVKQVASDDDHDDDGIDVGDDGDPQAKLPPSERVICPKDVVSFSDEDEAIYVIGTRGGKVTRISGLDSMTNIKVSLILCERFGTFYALYACFSLIMYLCVDVVRTGPCAQVMFDSFDDWGRKSFFITEARALRQSNRAHFLY